eukprot:scaffold51671_cov66-Phaeocystis_antarctica.AAC.1
MKARLRPSSSSAASSAGAKARSASGGSSEAHTSGAGRGTAAEAGTVGVQRCRYFARVEAAGALIASQTKA